MRSGSKMSGHGWVTGRSTTKTSSPSSRTCTSSSNFSEGSRRLARTIRRASLEPRSRSSELHLPNRERTSTARITSGRCPASPLAINAGGAAPTNARSCRHAATIRICRGEKRVRVSDPSRNGFCEHSLPGMGFLPRLPRMTRRSSFCRVLTNRSAPHARVTPVLTVSDVRAAVAWYSEVFGFVEHVRIGRGIDRSLDFRASRLPSSSSPRCGRGGASPVRAVRIR